MIGYLISPTGCRPHLSAIILSAVILSAVVLPTVTADPAAAQRTTTKEVVSHDRCYQLAQSLESSGKYAEARDCIRDMLAEERTPDERVVLLRFKAQLEVELGNFRQAIRDIEASGETGVLTDVEMAENYFFLGRLYLGVEPPDYDKAIENLRQFIKATDSPEPDAYFYLGQALAMTGRYREAIPHARKAIELSEKPRENHFRLLLFCYAELNDYERLVPLVERMLTRFSVKDEYLSQLAGGYQELGREKEAFHVQAFRYELGFLDSEDEFVGMADLYLVHDNPHRAARILEKEMKAGRVRRTEKNLEKLGNMWFLAREYDKARLYLGEAAELAETGELDFHLGQIYLGDQNWSRAETHFRRALRKGGLKVPCAAHVFLGHTLHSQDRHDEAREAFLRGAEDGPEDCVKEARQWEEYLGSMWDGPSLLKTKNYEFMTKAVNQLQKSAVALLDNENVRALAEEALDAAKAAVTAGSEKIRRSKLAEYERARDSALRHLNADAMEEARRDRSEAETVLAEASRYDLTEDEIKLVTRLNETTRRRIEALEQARADLDRAAAIAADAEESLRKSAEENP